MAELSLHTTDFINKKTEYVAWRPKGTIISIITTHRMRLKWLEIVCDLVSPKKRDQYKTIQGWQYLCEYWTQELRDEWIELGKPNKTYSHGRLLEDKTAAQKMWDNRITPDLINLLGYEPRGYENVTNTWLWSEHERKTLFIVVNNDIDEEQLINEYGLGKFYVKNGTLVATSGARLKYETNAGLSVKTIEDINNQEIVVHPKFDAPIAKTYFNSPNLDELVIS